MENQHRKIKGYRELSQEEIDLMNRIKAHPTLHLPCWRTKRWVSIGATDLQTGLMALTRSVAQPDFF